MILYGPWNLLKIRNTLKSCDWNLLLPRVGLVTSGLYPTRLAVTNHTINLTTTRTPSICLSTGVLREPRFALQCSIASEVSFYSFACSTHLCNSHVSLTESTEFMGNSYILTWRNEIENANTIWLSLNSFSQPHTHETSDLNHLDALSRNPYIPYDLSTNTVVDFVNLNFSKNHLARFDALFKTYLIHIHTLEYHALLINNDTYPMSFFYENFVYSYMGPWNEVIQKS